jgi:hypothetical protein
MCASNVHAAAVHARVSVMEYLISRDGRRNGPYSAEAIQQLRAEGRILDTDLCWAEGMPGWALVMNAFDVAVDLPQQEQGPEDAAAPPLAATPPGPVAPMPPSLHWFVVLALSVVTLGVFGWAWLFVQAAWVRRFDADSRAAHVLIAGLFTALVGGYVAGTMGTGNEQQAALVEMLGTLAAGLLVILAAFRMRDSIVRHFTHGEPMNVSINGVMTFFFTFIYLQYHLTRIAEEKRRRGGRSPVL